MNAGGAAGSASGKDVDVVAVNDGAPLGRGIVLVVALCAGVSFLDGFDILAISYVAPAIGAAWQLPKEAFGPIFAAHYVGAAIGAVLFGWYADRYGRRMGVILPTALFGLFAIATVWAPRLSLALRPARADRARSSAARSRTRLRWSPNMPRSAPSATLVSLMYAAFPLGGVIGGPVSAFPGSRAMAGRRCSFLAACSRCC